MLTIRDIAKLSGFSVTTVSRALNNEYDVSESTKKRIQQIAKERNYTPNRSARRLVTRRSNRIGYLIYEFGKAAGEDNFFYETLRGMQRKCVELGYELAFLIGNIHITEELDAKMIESLIVQHDLAGLIMMGYELDEDKREKLAEAKIPIVCIDGRLTGEYLGKVSVDNYAAAYAAVRHMYENNRRRHIVFLNGKHRSYACSQRLNGYRDAMGADFDPNNVYYGEYRETLSAEIIDSLIEQHLPIDGIFAANDMMAIGAITSLNEHRVRVGEAVDVIGFDDIAISSYIRQPLSTISLDKQLLGQTCVSLLVDMIQEKDTPRERFIPFELKLRQTTAS